MVVAISGAMQRRTKLCSVSVLSKITLSYARSALPCTVLLTLFKCSDFVSAHWYGCSNGTCSVQEDVLSFQTFVTELVSVAAGRDVWIPEFQRYGDVEGQQGFLEKVLPWLDSQKKVKRYAYFMVVEGILTTNGALKTLGSVYTSAI